MVDKDLFLTALSTCVFVEGFARGLVCDLQRQQFYIIPKDLSSLVLRSSGNKVESIYTHFGGENRQTLDEYFAFLAEHHYVFFTPHKTDTGRFPALSLWDKEYHNIENAIIDIDENSDFDVLQLIEDLIGLDCKYLQVRYFKKVIKEEFLSVLKQVDETELVNIEFVFPFNEFFLDIDLEKIFLLHQRLGTVIVYNSPVTETKYFHAGVFKICYTTENIDSHLHCGVIHPSWFISSMALYVDAKTSNSCLHKKISIDSAGNIKNCPGMMESFGNVKDTRLATALNKKGFKKHWHTTKDRVNICKDCEFRYVCTDCRAYLQQPEDHLSKPLKCGYDPYTNTWENWATNPLSKKGIDYHGLEGLVKR